MAEQLATMDAPTLWQSTQADNLLHSQDKYILAYFWDTLKLEKVRTITSSSGEQWAAAADLALWLLTSQMTPDIRPYVRCQQQLPEIGPFR